jgi:hypothetical protein
MTTSTQKEKIHSALNLLVDSAINADSALGESNLDNLDFVIQTIKQNSDNAINLLLAGRDGDE